MIEELKKNAEKITMPAEMRARIIRKCHLETEERSMNKTREKTILRKPVAVAAAIALCICLTGVTALAATGSLQGFFKDIKRWDGAITGTTYEQATDEISISAEAQSGELQVEITLLKPDAAPYAFVEQLDIGAYKIVDAQGNILAEGSTEPAEIIYGKVSVTIPMDGALDGSCRLLVSSFTGHSKADQPLAINGSWGCEIVCG